MVCLSRTSVKNSPRALGGLLNSLCRTSQTLSQEMTRSDIADREPCPWRIVDDIGGAYCMGAIGGGIFHIIKGSLNAPKGSRMHGAASAMAARGPVLGGQFAVWGGLFACCDCSLTAIRQKVRWWFGRSLVVTEILRRKKVACSNLLSRFIHECTESANNFEHFSS